MRTLKLVISFDGTDYSGWQRQDNGITVQEEIERCVSLICNAPLSVHGAGRTDAGVHALGMAAHFQTRSSVSCADMIKGLNSLLPRAIRVIALSEKPDDFHARFSACAKTYRYAIYTGPIHCPTRRLYTTHIPYELKIQTLHNCLEMITGTHDFSSFENTGSRDKSNSGGRGAVRTIHRTWLEQPDGNEIHLFLTGDGFLRHMVRNLVGTILEVARGKREEAELQTILTARDRNIAGTTAPPQGLTLMRVHYTSESDDHER
jgi:tRNA pseudouridine38-40 synthase